MRADLKGTVLNMQPTVIKGIVHPKITFLTLYLLTHMLSQICINLFISCVEYKIRYFEECG